MRCIDRKLTGKHIVSLGCIILGIGFIIFALVHMGNSSGITHAIGTEIIVTPTVSSHSVFKDSFGTSGILEEATVELKADIVLYPLRPKKGENFGNLTIPVLKRVIPIIQGADEDELKKGVGHFVQSVLPGEADNSVLSGHRDTVFKELGKLKVGDELITETSAGTFTYVIKQTRIVHKDNKTVIVPTDHAVLTVTTCYPFRYIGDAPDRYIITADLIDPQKKKG
ncbi:MAG: class D sortase [Paenibacillaceae bacterium]